ncbi:hypothetical protein SHO565_55610 [Streptomyces sp. HO565]
MLTNTLPLKLQPHGRSLDRTAADPRCGQVGTYGYRIRSDNAPKCVERTVQTGGLKLDLPRE